jgi:hypothetical protein
VWLAATATTAIGCCYDRVNPAPSRVQVLTVLISGVVLAELGGAGLDATCTY